MRIGYLISAIVVGLVVILALQYRDVWLTGWGFFADEPPIIEPVLSIVPVSQPAVPERVQPPPATTAAQPPAPVVPPLAESDDYMRDLLTAFSAPPAWSEQTDLARRLAVVLSSAAAGGLPRSQLGFLQPEAGFPAQAVGDDGKSFLLDPVGFARFEPVVAILTAVPAQSLARIFLASEPLLVSATAELGEGETVRALLNRALDEVLTTPVLTQPVVLKQPGVLYEFADPELEARSDLQKQLLRMGPGAVSALQSYAQAVVQALNVESAELRGSEAGQAPEEVP
ncbi:MAG: DUF3014 domain-containing protein [Pseudomonadales bacterium]